MTKPFPPKSIVLYADDDQDDIDLVRESFQEYSKNIELITFKNGIELLSFLHRLRSSDPLPCLIILDINMPLMSGKEVLRKLRGMERFGDVAVILFSTSTLPSEAAFANSFDAGFITKPLHRSQVYQLVDQMVEHCADDVKRHIKKNKGK